MLFNGPKISLDEPISIIGDAGADLKKNLDLAKRLIDIAVYGKAISNGYPMAAIVGKRDVMDAAESTFISSTYWTERIEPVTSIATINKMQENDVPSYICKIGDMTRTGWENLVRKMISRYIPRAYLRFLPSILFMTTARHCTHYSLRKCWVVGI